MSWRRTRRMASAPLWAFLKAPAGARKTEVAAGDLGTGELDGRPRREGLRLQTPRLETSTGCPTTGDPETGDLDGSPRHEDLRRQTPRREILMGDADGGLDNGLDTTRCLCGEQSSTASAKAQADGASMMRGLGTRLRTLESRQFAQRRATRRRTWRRTGSSVQRTLRQHQRV